MVSLEDMRQALETSSTIVIDIREPHEHANGVASGAQLFRWANWAIGWVNCLHLAQSRFGWSAIPKYDQPISSGNYKIWVIRRKLCERRYEPMGKASLAYGKAVIVFAVLLVYVTFFDF